MRLRPFPLVLFLAAYLPVEDFVLKWLPVPDTAILLLHQLPDFLIAAVCFLVLCDRLMRFRGLQGFGRGFDWPLAIFLLSATFTLILNRNAVVGLWFASLKALFRYLILAYLVRTYRVSAADTHRLVNILLVGVWIQIALGLAQLVGGIPVRDFLASRNITNADLAGYQPADYTGTRFEGVNNPMGTMGNMINYGAFLVVGIAIFLCCVPPRKRIRRWAGVALSFLCIFSSNSRSALIAAVVVLLCYVYLNVGKRIALLLVGATIASLALGAIFLAGGQSADIAKYGEDYHSKARFFRMFSSDYIEEAKSQRLGLVMYLAPEFLSDPVGVPFGYSPDPKVIVDKVHTHVPDVPASLIEAYAGLVEDVYWLAILIQFGLIGLISFAAAVFWAIRALARKFRQETEPASRTFALLALLLMIASVLMNCFNQVFLIRQFSFCLWVLFGLTFLPRRVAVADSVATQKDISTQLVRDVG